MQNDTTKPQHQPRSIEDRLDKIEALVRMFSRAEAYRHGVGPRYTVTLEELATVLAPFMPTSEVGGKEGQQLPREYN